MTSYLKNIINNYFDEANLIISKNKTHGNLWLGNSYAAHNIDFLSNNNITVIINCTPDIPYFYEICKINELTKIHIMETYRVPVYDSRLDYDILLMENYFITVLPFILKKLVDEGKNILIHCRAGRQRSGCIVAAILYTLQLNSESHLQDQNLIMNDIIQYIIKCRPQAFSFGLRINFKKSLENYFNLEIK
jgi:hypothetical protein